MLTLLAAICCTHQAFIHTNDVQTSRKCLSRFCFCHCEKPAFVVSFFARLYPKLSQLQGCGTEGLVASGQRAHYTAAGPEMAGRIPVQGQRNDGGHAARRVSCPIFGTTMVAIRTLVQLYSSHLCTERAHSEALVAFNHRNV